MPQYYDEYTKEIRENCAYACAVRADMQWSEALRASEPHRHTDHRL